MLDVLLKGLSMLLEFAALVALRIREPALPRPYRVPGGLAGAIAVGIPPVALLVLTAVRTEAEPWLRADQCAGTGRHPDRCGVVAYFIGERIRKAMIIADLSANRRPHVSGAAPHAEPGGRRQPHPGHQFSMGHVTLEPNGGQVPWHNQEQEEIYFIVEGSGEMCLGEERRSVHAGQAVYIPPRVFHQLTNTGRRPAHDLLLRAGGRCGALAPGTGWHAAARGRGSAAAAPGRPSAMHGETEKP